MKDIYQQITDQILATVDEAGAWKPCWQGMTAGLPTNGTTGKRYRGINILSCWVASMIRGYGDQRWASYRQWAAIGAQVRKGERGTPIVYYNVQELADGSERAFARGSHVFNVDQVDNAPAADGKPIVLLDEAARIAACEAWLAERAHAFKLTHTSENRAYYQPSIDTVNMPAFGLFVDAEHYYSTLFHELTHWTGAKHRLDRSELANYKGEGRAREELVAELGAAFLAAEHGLTAITRDDHTSYIASWLKALKNDKRCIATAASHASKAVDFLDALAGEQRLTA